MMIAPLAKFFPACLPGFCVGAALLVSRLSRQRNTTCDPWIATECLSSNE